ncbi:cathepsin O isoform X2 [Pleurodeles waltl]|uniref:cathepsin O isoform X2 n=1 Tax=Pleurodeles waltl TaxID=8319 RepID=UPI0037095809
MFPALLMLCVLPALAQAFFPPRSVARAHDPRGGTAPYNSSGRGHPAQEAPDGQNSDIFLNFLFKYNKPLPAGTHDYRHREQSFLASIRRQNYLNAMSQSSGGNNTAVYGINQFSDLLPEEFRARFLRSFSTKISLSSHAKKNLKQTLLSKRFDWRDANVVTGVKDQQSCGGCWAFSVVEAIETVHAIRSHSLEELSVQEVIDCSEKNFGCNGGSPTTALRWLNETQLKLVRDSEYRYKAQTGICHYFPRSLFGISIKGFEAYNLRGHEEEMRRMLVQLGPLIVLVDAISWQDYLGGIIQHHCSAGESNHAVLITGFDTSGEVPYWIVRNSWGASWGIAGYVHIKIGDNVCGLGEVLRDCR